jgi:hypothetical protein
MKYIQQRIFLILITLTVGIGNSSAQDVIKAVEVGASFTVYNRAGLNDYLKAVSDSAQLTATLAGSPSYGFQLRYLVRKSKIEIEGGLAYSFSLNNVKSAAGGSVNAKTHDIGFILGVNYVPVPFLFVGVQVIANSFGGTTKLYGDLPTGITENLGHPPDAGVNIFRGYSFIGRTQLGFNIPFTAGWNSGMRVFGYYDLGSGFDFYNTMDDQLAAYNGSRKTKTNGWGCGMLFYFGKKQ